MKMIAGTYLYARVLIVEILLKAKKLAEQGGAAQGSINQTVEENFMVVASVLYFLFM